MSVQMASPVVQHSLVRRGGEILRRALRACAAQWLPDMSCLWATPSRASQHHVRVEVIT